MHYATLPAGTIELYRETQPEETLLLEVEVVAGETTTLRSP